MKNYRERKETAEAIKSECYIEKDKQLLAQFEPKSPLLRRSLNTSIGATLAFDLVFTLLKHVSREEIEKNRCPEVVEETPEVEEKTSEVVEEISETTGKTAKKTTGKSPKKKSTSQKKGTKKKK